MRQRESHFTVYIAQEQISSFFFCTVCLPKVFYLIWHRKNILKLPRMYAGAHPLCRWTIGTVWFWRFRILARKARILQEKNFTKVAFIHSLAPGALLSSASLTKLEQQKFEVKSKNKKITTGVDYAYSIFAVVSTGSWNLIRLTWTCHLLAKNNPVNILLQKKYKYVLICFFVNT